MHCYIRIIRFTLDITSHRSYCLQAYLLHAIKQIPDKFAVKFDTK